MFLKKVFILLTIVSVTGFVNAQNQDQLQGPKIKFDKKQHDFGTIKEEAGKVSCIFNFENVGTIIEYHLIRKDW